MDDQLSLFERYREPMADLPLARATDPETSHEAAATVQLNRNRLIVLGWLRQHGPATHEELADGVAGHMTDSGARGRCNELHKAGLVEPCGQSTTRTGRKCLLWRATHGNTMA